MILNEYLNLLSCFGTNILLAVGFLWLLRRSNATRSWSRNYERGYYLSHTEPDLGVLLSELNSQFDSVRIGAAQGLGRLADARAVRPLIEFLDRDASMAKWHAMLSLGRIGEVSGAEALLRVLNDPRVDIRNVERLYAGNALGLMYRSGNWTGDLQKRINPLREKVVFERGYWSYDENGDEYNYAGVKLSEFLSRWVEPAAKNG